MGAVGADGFMICELLGNRSIHYEQIIGAIEIGFAMRPRIRQCEFLLILGVSRK